MSWSLGFGSGHGNQHNLVTVHYNLVLFVGLSDRTVGREHSPTLVHLMETVAAAARKDESQDRASCSIVTASDKNLGAQAGAMECSAGPGHLRVV